MKKVTVSPKYQVVIPRDLRRQLNIQVGQKLRARVRGDHKLPMADSLILITAQEHQATLWTQDADLKGHNGVKYKAKTT